MERFDIIMLHLEFSLKYKISLQTGKTEFIQKWFVALMQQTFDKITPKFW